MSTSVEQLQVLIITIIIRFRQAFIIQAGTSRYTSLLSQYSPIKNGSYKKALVAYYTTQKE